MEPTMFTVEESLLEEICADELWGGVYCALPPDHAGSHASTPSHVGGCELTWSAKLAAKPAEPSTAHIESFLRMVRSATVQPR